MMVRAVDIAYQKVREGIISGRYPPAQRITEQEVAAAAGVSRTPVREALRRLHAEGLVSFTPNQGAVVTALSREDADDIFELRALLEGLGAERAAERATPAQLKSLRALAEEQYEESVAHRDGYLQRIGTLNSRFHREIADAAASPRLSRVLASVLEAPLIMKTFQNYTPDELVRSAGHHLELVRALEMRDGAWAASIMRAHILAAKRTLKR